MQKHDVLLVASYLGLLLAAAVAVAISRLTCPVRPSKAARPHWLSPDPAVAWAERFFLRYSAVWILWFAALVASGQWRHFDKIHYAVVGAAMTIPPVVAPAVLYPAPLARAPWRQWPWVRANVWCAIVSVVGNLLW